MLSELTNEKKPLNKGRRNLSNLLIATMERNNILPDDLVEDILLRLTIRDLLRLRCVSKEWCALIDNPRFIRKVYMLRYSIGKVDESMPHFVMDMTYNKFSLLYTPQGESITLDLTADLERDSKAVINIGRDQFHIECNGCVNGIICLTWERRKSNLAKDSFLALWNPATREFKTVVYPHYIHYSYDFRYKVFGFDSLSNDFKVLGQYLNRATSGYDAYYELYSVKGNSWKRIKNPPYFLDFYGTDGYLNGVYYWITELKPIDEWPWPLVIVSFNFSSEVFKVSDAPNDIVSRVLSFPVQTKITLYKESLALVICHQVQGNTLYNIDIWVVTEFDDCESPVVMATLIYNRTISCRKRYICPDNKNEW
ncbi:putative F-box protein At3g16210 [Spinacia oleracea]|uniref:F-box protein At3g16210 n=1 Tax=Spinacia oleracea TaxID=3562 RepID=A0A9R0JRV4_SPIOL|nr:putative F-box protein At3g16210 [Spinacia oleracea]